MWRMKNWYDVKNERLVWCEEWKIGMMWRIKDWYITTIWWIQDCNNYWYLMNWRSLQSDDFKISTLSCAKTKLLLCIIPSFCPILRHFWDVVMGFPKELQKRMLLFTTGSDRIPIGGMSEMSFKITKVENVAMWVNSGKWSLGFQFLPGKCSNLEMRMQHLYQLKYFSFELFLNAM